jgi:cytochrome c2
MRPLAVTALLLLALAGCGGTTRSVPNASPARGKQLIEYYGCGACHQIGGVTGADGHVGPSLKLFAGRTTIAGKLPNTLDNLVRWIQHPQRIVPGSDMPELGVPKRGARNIAAYLYSGQ